MSKALKRLFIANRGEIARRIALTAQRLGIETVVITDKITPPQYLAGIVSHFVTVPSETAATYLDADFILAKAREAGCDSVHPGFGFLSENAEFAAKTLELGMTWVGPNPAAITAMASKASARAYAEKAQVPCVKGLADFSVPDDEQGDFSALENFAAKAGYPLLLKAAYGGGGKGMRLIHHRDELRPAALRAKSEARNSFGNGSLICEQYLGAPRHVEVQILADKHGHVVAVGDRDCSLQRRHQKIIEEAPATDLTPATRTALHQAAINLAAAVGYDSTGTVEFLVDWSDTSRNAELQRFYFLEMNTRLQVEHPVTEEVFGLDLVEWQLRVATGEALPGNFAERSPRGHSIEVRIYAEDVHKDFFPAPGPVAAFQPALGPGLRWELGLSDGDEITGRFDPMIAKLVATAADRQGALARIADALRRTVFAGPENNISLLEELVTRSAFARGPVTTHYLGENLPSLIGALKVRYDQNAELGSALLDQLASAATGQGPSSIGGSGLGHNGMTAATVTHKIFSSPTSTSGAALAPQGANNDAPRAVQFTAQSEHIVSTGSGRYGEELRIRKGSGVVNDAFMRPFWYAALNRLAESQIWVGIAGSIFTRQFRTNTPRLDRERAGGNTSEIVAPVPGRVIAVKVVAGQSVELGQTLFVLESMKMEFEVKASGAGSIAQLSVKQDEQVTAGQQLAKWAP